MLAQAAPLCKTRYSINTEPGIPRSQSTISRVYISINNASMATTNGSPSAERVDLLDGRLRSDVRVHLRAISLDMLPALDFRVLNGIIFG